MLVSSLFGNCNQRADGMHRSMWGARLSGLTVQWVAVVNPMIVFTVSKHNQWGCLVLSGGIGWSFTSVRPCVGGLLRPRWGWIPCCSVCREAERTWTLPRCRWSWTPVLPRRNWPVGHMEQWLESHEAQTSPRCEDASAAAPRLVPSSGHVRVLIKNQPTNTNMCSTSVWPSLFWESQADCLARVTVHKSIVMK